MSISSTSKPENYKSPIKKTGGLPLVNVKQAIGKIVKTLVEKDLAFMCFFMLFISAVGELFGTGFSFKWYLLQFIVVALFAAEKYLIWKEKITNKEFDK